MADRIVIPPVPMRVRTRIRSDYAASGWDPGYWTLVVFIRVIAAGRDGDEANAFTTDHRWLDLEGLDAGQVDVELFIDGEWQS